MDRAEVAAWVTAYERAWRSAGTDALAELFAPDVRYSPAPWSGPIQGLDALATFWEAERDGPDEPFDLTSEVVAVDGAVAVVRVEVTYDRPIRRWRDLWVIELGPAGRCIRFEEWPFAPEQDDGHDPG